MEKLGLDITDNFKVCLLDIKEVVLEGLKNNNVEHSVAFDKINNKGVKETIITMRNPDIEISLENDIVQYIKTVNTKYSQVDVLKNISENAAVHIPTIKKNIEKKFNVQSNCIKIEAIDSTKMSLTVIIKYDNNAHEARIHVIRDAFGNIFVNTITHII